MGPRLYKAIVYIQVEEGETHPIEEADIRDYCVEALKLDLDTEESDERFHITAAEVDWGTFAKAADLEKADDER